MTTTETVHNRIDFAIDTLTPTQMAVGLGLILLAGFILLVSQNPMVHDAMHNFRHGAGVTCH